MATYSYKGVTGTGVAVRGQVQAESAALAAAELSGMGYIPVSISEKKESPLDELAAHLWNRVDPDQIIFFTRQLFTIIKSGIPLLSGLGALEQTMEDKRMREVVAAVRKDVDQGKRFSAALSKHPAVFPELYVNMVDCGEMGGFLEETLLRLIRALEFNRKTRTNVKSALRYPLMVVSGLGIAFVVIVTLVIPRFAVIFEKSNMALPLPTRVMIGLNYVVQGYWYLVLLVMAALTGAFISYVRTDSGRLEWDHFKLKMPILGPIFMKIYLSRFASTLETLTRTGISMDVALEVVSRNIGNEYIAQKVREMTARVQEGLGLTKALLDSRIFPPLVVQMALTGEESGSLDDMLREVSDYYEREVEYTIGRLSSYIEPILIVGLGVMVLFMALAIFLPWWNMMDVMKGGK